MKLDPKITLGEFSAEMQHRVVRYSPRSLRVRQALNFARRHEDPDFYRVAASKVFAQKQFLRELNGPSFFERAFDYFSFGSLREVVMTVILVGIGVLGIDWGRRVVTSFSPSSKYDSMDFDELAQRLGYRLDSVEFAPDRIRPVQDSAIEEKSGSAVKSTGGKGTLTDEEVDRIATSLYEKIKSAKPADSSAVEKQTSLGPAPTEGESTLAASK